jgi:uncharacterized protein YoxC
MEDNNEILTGLGPEKKTDKGLGSKPDKKSDEEVLKRQDRYTRYILKRYPLLPILFGTIAFLAIALIMLFVLGYTNIRSLGDSLDASDTAIANIQGQLSDVVRENRSLNDSVKHFGNVANVALAKTDAIAYQDFRLKKLETGQVELYKKYRNLAYAQRLQNKKRVSFDKDKDQELKVWKDSVRKQMEAYLMANAPSFVDTTVKGNIPLITDLSGNSAPRRDTVSQVSANNQSSSFRKRGSLRQDDGLFWRLRRKK